jgi:hypothetical protein
MDDQTKFVALEIHVMVAKAISVQRPAATLLLSKPSQVASDNFQWNSMKFAEDKQLKFLRHF